ncbi:hypothetical protein [Ruegeria lacuscaerulensis]|uniref:hypothetical protein n=1 Tax=Ruegeria lacuscaerulensis TaxID=55218 RepID=UPI00147DB352|nr:hypothetical protein [Ruegeria lacuscaerulensis]
MAKTLKDLLLALLNATLILVAVCLFLGWKLASKVEGITTAFSEKVQIVAPLRDEIQGVRGELAALRSELASVQPGDVGVDSATQQRISETLSTLNALEEKMQTSQARIAEITEAPETLINTAIGTSADAIADRVIAIRGCEPTS